MQKIDIEKLLRWAYRDELPKAVVERSSFLPAAIRPGWAGMARYGEYLAVVQDEGIANRYGLVPLEGQADAEPHPDAVLVHVAVERLAECHFSLPEGWDPLADMGGVAAFGPEGWAAMARALGTLATENAAGELDLRRPPQRLVIRQAILGGSPVWEAEVPERRVVSEYGRAKWFRRARLEADGLSGPTSFMVEVDGFDYKRRRPAVDAYQKYELVPDLAPVIASRAEHEIWHAAMSLLADDLSGRLSAHTVLPPAHPSRPWETGLPEVRVLPSGLLPLARRAKKCAMAENEKRDAA
ncbi:hypothetical protein [Paracoccus sp. (in: a-proteobacteria)]|uniref:hypothetical protein n=1 Tax=Paracoccus sp. TaxID=267 RepID=UPI002AFFA564|nr:hypothetical protein [Paracoccus sp. (in: a-proteobacteria)]